MQLFAHGQVLYLFADEEYSVCVFIQKVIPITDLIGIVNLNFADHYNIFFEFKNWTNKLKLNIRQYLRELQTNLNWSSSNFIVHMFFWHEYCIPIPLEVFHVTFFATSYVLPLLLICGLYLCMLRKLWKGVAPGGRVSAESRRGKKRVTRMVMESYL